MNKRIVYLVVLLVVLIIAAVYFFKQTDQTAEVSPEKQETEKATEIKKTDVDVNKNPEKFPADIPIEQGAAILQNYNATAPDGRFQATRVFETKDTLAANLTIYRNYLTKSGYEVKSTVDQPNYKMVFGTKGNASLQISIDQNSVSNIKTVSISYTEQGKAPAPATNTAPAPTNTAPATPPTAPTPAQ